MKGIHRIQKSSGRVAEFGEGFVLERVLSIQIVANDAKLLLIFAPCFRDFPLFDEETF